jgi:predicted Zn finger-like uncharacterized protein
MIIQCTNCNKKFEVDPELIPEKGRTIQCGSCDHNWFYKKDISQPSSEIHEEIPLVEEAEEINISNQDIGEINIPDEKLEDKNDTKEIDDTTNSKKSNVFNKIISYLIVAIISFVALIIVLDTFKTPLNNIFPNLEQILFNLYETFEDIGLFFKDLIK